MVRPTPIGSNAQRQTMVVTLKNICRDYPAGGSILQELLQNADDAGATVVRFVLDEGTYSDEPLLDDHLIRYQGPALLAYNDAEFTDRDFENLKNTSNSHKLDDGFTTGRFGRGFNSVYNWTDSPSILSRDRLLILDPHEWWSQSLGVSPVYDFVANSSEPEMQNQVKAFQTVLSESDKPLKGTIIRVPLRTQEQATESEIVNRDATITEVRGVLETFALEFGETGLLFLRNIERVTIETTSGYHTDVRILNSKAVCNARKLIQVALQNASQDSQYTFQHAFQMEVGYTTGDMCRKVSFCAQHYISQHPTDVKLSKWLKAQKIIPWAAVVAKLEISKDFEGTLFSVLPLPLSTAQPVHIHGLFSISPDRARVYFENKQMTVKEPALWNRFLCEHTIPFAWASLLEFIAATHPEKSTFDWWPRAMEDEKDLLKDVLSFVVDVIQQKSLTVFPTVTGYLSAGEAILSSGNVSHILNAAMDEALLPIVYAPPHVRSSINHLFGKRQLNPQIVSEYLQGKNDRIRHWTEATKRTMLDYLLDDYPIYGPENLELFPFEEGTCRSLATGSAFCHRNNVEKAFFRSAARYNLDLSKCGTAANRAIRHFCKTKDVMYNVRYRTVEDFATFCMYELFQDVKSQSDVIVRETTDLEQLELAWKWISTSNRSITNKALRDLWLLPFSDNKFRKIKPSESSRVILMIARNDGLYELLDRIDKDKRTKAPRLLNLESIGLKSDDPLFSMSKKNEALYLWDAANLSNLVKWLSLNSAIVAECSPEDKDTLLEHIASRLRLEKKSLEFDVITSSIMSLPIFRKLRWNKNEEDEEILETSWTSIHASGISIGIPEETIPVLEIEGYQFIVAESGSDAKDILDMIKSHLVKTCTVPELIEEHILPSFNSSMSSAEIKAQVGEFLLSKHAELSVQARSQLRTIRIIPTETIDGQQGFMYRKISELVDRDVPELVGLFFSDEDVFVTKKYQEKYGDVLRLCGLKAIVDLELINERVEAYSISTKPVEEVEIVVHKLLESSFSLRTEDVEHTTIRTVAWLPIRDPSKNSLSLRSAKSCRGIDDQLVAGLVMPILNKPVSSAWKRLLGWNTRLTDKILLEQLDQAIALSDLTVVGAVLTRLCKAARFPSITPQLMSRPFVLVKDGTLQVPSKVFLGRCEGLDPFLQTVAKTFWHTHQHILRECGVRERPLFNDLNQAYATLINLAPLKLPTHFDAAVNLATQIAEFPRSKRNELRVLAEDGNFYPPGNLTYPNVKHMTNSKHEITYSRITMDTARKLGVELRSDRHLKELLEITDIEDDDEFDQREQITTRITDTLDRYPVESTFREYLANADDAGATDISWLLDERSHTTQNLLTEEMAQVQGPALLVRNNSVFSDVDFRGFKNVGEGSKRLDTTSIGQFGRGSQTMFHWTDVPIIISGEKILFLDPQQKLLPWNSRRGERKPGVITTLKKVREACPGHLEPFDDLWGYSITQDFYEGTIFRFPLRVPDMKSQLKTSSECFDVVKTQKILSTYRDEARVSLLFLKNINSIDYRIQGDETPEWAFERDTSENKVMPKADSTTGTQVFDVKCLTTFKVAEKIIKGQDNWRVARSVVMPTVSESQATKARVTKNEVCAVAGRLSSKAIDDSTKEDFFKIRHIVPRFFSTLPLPLESELPIHIHGTFSLSGDRRSLTVGEYGDPQHSALNKKLLQESIPEVYLAFLEDLARNHPHDLRRFWPQYVFVEPAKEILDSLLKKLPTSTRQVYLPATFGETNGSSTPVAFKDSVFHLDPTEISSLRQLLLDVDICLVQQLPSVVSNYLKKHTATPLLTETRLRSHFNTFLGRVMLKKVVGDDPKILNDLLKLALVTKSNPEALHGSCFLRLANKKLGTLLVRQKPEDPSQFFVASAKEIELFNFASDMLVSHTDWLPIAKVSSDKFFNVETLQLAHLPLLFKKRNGDIADKAWLSRFWAYFDSQISSKVNATSASDVASELPVCLSVRNGKMEVKTLSALEDLAAVVEPSQSAHIKLCERFPGLYVFQRDYLPASFRTSEASFASAKSFRRFLKAINCLCPKDRRIGDFVSSKILADDLKVFRDLVILHSSRTSILGLAVNTAEVVSFKTLISAIPLWESANQSKETLIPANKAYVLNDVVNGGRFGQTTLDISALLVPWMDKYDFFVRESKDLEIVSQFGATTVSPELALSVHILPLPPILPGTINWQKYLSLIACLDSGTLGIVKLKEITNICKDHKLAVDRSGTLRYTSELFDHKNQLFMSAFRKDQNSKFLHNDIRKHHGFWLRLGLKQNEIISLNASTYALCLGALHSRSLAHGNLTTDAELPNDRLTVLAPLTTSSSQTRHFTHHNWHSLTGYKVFVVQTDMRLQPQYRRRGMAAIATREHLLGLNEIISSQYVNICWSQTPFPVQQPADEVMVAFKSGKPPVLMVWKHLLHLKDQAQQLQPDQFSDFLKDLQQTYQYIQDHDCEDISWETRRKPVWLNLTSFDSTRLLLSDVKNSWVPAQNLLLSTSCDAGPIKAVKAGLLQYESLLRKMGCNAVTYSTVERPKLHDSHSIAIALRALRQKGELLDVEYISQGRSVKAHRVVLAAISEKCKRQFSGQWINQAHGNTINGVLIIKYDQFDATGKEDESFLSHHTLSTMIDYAYDNSVDWTDLQVVPADDADAKQTKLDKLLDLLKGADFWLIPALQSQVEAKILDAGRELINIANVERTEELAWSYNALSVAKYCEDFTTNNQIIIDMASPE